MNALGDAFGWLGLLLLAAMVVSVTQLVELLCFRWRGTMTTGRVITLEESQSSDGEGGPVFTPVVGYQVDGQPRRIKSVVAMAPALYRTGQEVPVYYFPDNPSNARVVTAREFYKWIFVILGCLLFALIFVRK